MRIPESPGLTLDASDPAFYNEQNRDAYLWIHEHAPVYWCDARHTNSFWNVCTHEDIRIVATNPHLFTTRDGIHLNAAAFPVDGNSSRMPDDPRLPLVMRAASIVDPPEEHQRLRAAINPHMLKQGLAKDWEPTFREAVRSVVNEIPPEEEIDFMSTFASRVPLLVTTTLRVGTDREKDFEHWATTILESFEPGAQVDWEALIDMIDFLESEIRDRRTAPRNDLITTLRQSNLRDEEIVMWCWSVLAAGLETMGGLIGGGIRLLLLNPEQKNLLIEVRRSCETPSRRCCAA